MHARACRMACGSRTAKRKAAGCCSHPSACSRPMRSPPRSSSAAAAKARWRRSSTILPAPTRPPASAGSPMSRCCCAAWRKRSLWTCNWTCDVSSNGSSGVPSPIGLLAELTHRCPLACPYCSNPLALEPRAQELDLGTWFRLFHEAAALGVLQAHLSGGEPAARRDLVDITAAARLAGLYTNLITSGIGLTVKRLVELREAGLDHVQGSIQDRDRHSADHIAGYEGAFARKCELANAVVGLKLPLTVNVVVHRANIERIGDMVDLAVLLGAARVEVAHVQYYGWGLKNRAMLMPSRPQV